MCLRREKKARGSAPGPSWGLVPRPHLKAETNLNDQSLPQARTRFFSAPLSETDPELAAAISAELLRQQDGIELIASENIVSAAVLEAQGSVLTNKYAEG